MSTSAGHGEQSRHLRGGNIPTGSGKTPHNTHHGLNRARVGVSNPDRRMRLQGNRGQHGHQRPAGKSWAVPKPWGSLNCTLMSGLEPGTGCIQRIGYWDLDSRVQA